MRGKKAKELRRYVKAMNQIEKVLSKESLPDVQYEDVVPNPYKPWSETRVLVNCTRGMYQRMKRGS